MTAYDFDMDSLCIEALELIDRERYTEQLYEDGMHTVLKYGIACCQKQCKVMCIQDKLRIF